MKRLLTILFIMSFLFACSKKGTGDSAVNPANETVKGGTANVVQKKSTAGGKSPSAGLSIAGKSYGFTGRIIDITDEFIVVKRGDFERKYYFSTDSVFYDKAGDKLTKDELWICHYVGVNAVEKGGKKVIKSLQVIKTIKCEQ